jgi:uncharacterized protein YutE (UPF0331/DUF86 family)
VSKEHRWIEVRTYTESALLHFGKAVEIQSGRNSAITENALYTIDMATMHAMQVGYTSLENSFLKILELFGEDPPTGKNWHKELLGRVCMDVDIRPALVNRELRLTVEELRSFRHVASHAYDHLDLEKLTLALRAASVFVEHYPPVLHAFVRKVCGDGDDDGDDCAGSPSLGRRKRLS